MATAPTIAEDEVEGIDPDIIRDRTTELKKTKRHTRRQYTRSKACERAKISPRPLPKKFTWGKRNRIKADKTKPKARSVRTSCFSTGKDMPAARSDCKPNPWKLDMFG